MKYKSIYKIWYCNKWVNTHYKITLIEVMINREGRSRFDGFIYISGLLDTNWKTKWDFSFRFLNKQETNNKRRNFNTTERS